MSHQEAFSFAKLFLRSLSDRTFLSSISYIDFEQQYISIRRNFWKTLLGFIFTRLPIAFEKNTRVQICSSLKTLFIERYSEVSANMLKSFMLSSVKNSFLDFKNIMFYMLDYYRNGNPFRKKHKLLRQQYYFERKAKKYYLRSINNTYIEDAQATQDYIPDEPPQHEHIDQPEPEVLSDIYMSDVDIPDSESHSNISEFDYIPPVVTEAENVDRLQRQINSFHPHNYETEEAYDAALAKLHELDNLLRNQCNWPEILPFSQPPLPPPVFELFREQPHEDNTSTGRNFNNSFLADNTNSEPVGTFVRPDGSWIRSDLNLDFVNGEASASISTKVIRGAIPRQDDDDSEGFYF